MELPSDNELFRWLDNYKVADADDCLHACIVTQAMLAPVTERPQAWLSHAVMLAAMAVVGLWLGNIMLVSQDEIANVHEHHLKVMNVDEVILGPKSVGEVAL